MQSNVAGVLQRAPGRGWAAIITGFVLFAFSYVTDLILYWKGVQAADTLLNNLAIAICGVFLVLALQAYPRWRQTQMRIHKRGSLLSAELNYRIQSGLSLVRASSTIDDRARRESLSDQGIKMVESALADLLPVVMQAESALYDSANIRKPA